MKRRSDIFLKTGSKNALSLTLCLSFLAVASPDGFGQAKPKPTSIEEKTKIHRLASANRSVYDAFVYLNRIPDKVDEDEEILDFTARVYSLLANQEGRILIKLPKGMNRQAYLGYKTFLSTDAEVSNGNCVVCHAPEKFTDLKEHVLSEGGKALPTPSLRNMSRREVDVAEALRTKLAVAEKPGVPKDYKPMKLDKADLTHLEAFLKLLDDVEDKNFRGLILQAKVLDTLQN